MPGSYLIGESVIHFMMKNIFTCYLNTGEKQIDDDL